MKKLVVAVLVGAIWFGSSMPADAAGLRDVFDAEYYAAQYDDLAKAFGNDADALYQHFVNFGAKEGRNMSPILDIAKYRNTYKDLDQAFGDNWDAYVDHYFEHGIKENRDNGTDFDVKKYVSSYEDLSKAFGEDYKKAAKHYLETGKKENRGKGHKEQIKKHDNKPAVQPPVSLERSERTDYPGGYSIADFNAKGDCVKVTYYLEDGTLEWYMINEYDSNGVYLKHFSYNADGTLNMWCEYFYEADGSMDYSKNHFNDGTYSINIYDENEVVVESYDYDANGELTGSSRNVMENGEWVGIIEYDAAGNVIMEFERIESEDGSLVFVPVGSGDVEDGEVEEEVGFTGTSEEMKSDGSKVVYEYENGALLKSSFYNAAGELTGYTTFVYDEYYREIGHATYDANGNRTSYAENTLDAEGRIIAVTSVDNAGFITTNMYDYTHSLHIIICYDAEGRFLSNTTYVWDENHDYVEAWFCDAAGNIITKYDMVKDADGNYTLIPKEA